MQFVTFAAGENIVTIVKTATRYEWTGPIEDPVPLKNFALALQLLLNITA